VFVHVSSVKKLSTHLRHLTAGLSATAAYFHTLHHHLIDPKAFAITGACFTDVPTDPAGLSMKIGHAQHEICTCLTNFGSVQQQLYVARLRVISTHLQTMRYSFYANIMAVMAFFDALTHPFID
jgi:hypothetical protein